MHALELIITSIVTITAAFIGAWFGAKFAAKRGEKTQAAFLQKIHEATNSLSAIVRRLRRHTRPRSKQSDRLPRRRNPTTHSRVRGAAEAENAFGE